MKYMGRIGKMAQKGDSPYTIRRHHWVALAPGVGDSDIFIRT